MKHFTHTLALSTILIGASSGCSTPGETIPPSHHGGFTPTPYAVALAGKLARVPLAVDSKGHAWLFGGSFIPAEPLEPGVWQDAWLRKADPAGLHEFTVTLQADDYRIEPRAVDADKEGNVIFAGQVVRLPGAAQSLEIAGQPVMFPSGTSVFVAKLDSAGQFIWARVIPIDPQSTEHDTLQLMDLGVDEQSRVYLAGFLDGTVEFGLGPVTSHDAVVLVLDANGSPLTTRVSSLQGASFLQLDVEPSGATWLARATYHDNVIVEKFDVSGTSSFEFVAPVCWVDDLAFAPDGQGGFFAVRAEDPAGQCTSLAMQHVVGTGTLQWGAEGYYARRPILGRGAPGRVWLGMGLEGTIDLGLAQLTGTDVDDILLAEIDPMGKANHVTTHGGPGKDEAVQIVGDAYGGRFVAGHFATTIDFNSTTLTNDSGAPQAIFLTRFAP